MLVPGTHHSANGKRHFLLGTASASLPPLALVLVLSLKRNAISDFWELPPG
jgi:hypothetical protein